jgi:hypothetical protein
MIKILSIKFYSECFVVYDCTATELDREIHGHKITKYSSKKKDINVSFFNGKVLHERFRGDVQAEIA